MAGTGFSWKEIGASGHKAWFDLSTAGLKPPSLSQVLPVADTKAPGWPGLLSAYVRPTSLSTLLADSADFIVISNLSQLIAIPLLITVYF